LYLDWLLNDNCGTILLYKNIIKQLNHAIGNWQIQQVLNAKQELLFEMERQLVYKQ
jgi:hypothetical protein